MLSAREVSAGLYGAYRLARLDTDGLRYFDASPQGFWRALVAGATIVALPHALLLFIRFAGEPEPPDGTLFAVVNAISYVMAWTMFPLVMFHLSILLDRRHRYLRYVVAYNWAAVLQNGLYLPFAIAERSGLLPPEAALFLLLLVLLAMIAYSCTVAHLALEVPVLTAVGIVVLDLMLGIFLQVWTDSLLQ